MMSTYANIHVGDECFCICNDGFPFGTVPLLAPLIEKAKGSKYPEATLKGLLLENDVYLGTAALASYDYTVQENTILFQIDGKQFKIEVREGRMYHNGREITEGDLWKVLELKS
jgi:hypothetical protein